MQRKIPIVTIVGRPNVGKSSLFNALASKKKSIVDEKEGVTRDIIMEKINYNGVTFILYDTAGYLESEDTLTQIIRKKIEETLVDTDLVLFIIDGREIHPLDYELARLLKKINKKTFLVANKLDNEKLRNSAVEIYSFGFDDICMVSVAHNYGITDLLEKISGFLTINNKTNPSYTNKEESKEIKICIVGKPNVGKSMLLNAILGYERSIVFDKPGTTRDSVDDIIKYNEKIIRLIDTAGIRKKARIKEDIEYYSMVRTIGAIERSDVAIQLLDPTTSISHQDKSITGLIVSKGCGIVLAYNKWDIISPKNEENYILMEKYRKLTYSEIPAYSFIPVEFISAKEKYKIQKLLNTALKVYEDRKYRIPTSILNEWLQKNIKESNINYPVSQLKVYYATQVETSPPHFVFFINNKKYLKKDYEKFLENKLRLAFEFTGVPLKISFREKNKKEEE